MEAILGIGVPGSGKTTTLLPLARKLGYTYINGDDIRQELTGDPSDHSREKEVWILAYDRIKKGLAHSGIVVDATNSRVSDRKKLIQFCRLHGATEITGYWFNGDINTYINRNNQRERTVPEKSIKTMYDRLLYSPPAIEEGFNRIEEIRG